MVLVEATFNLASTAEPDALGLGLRQPFKISTDANPNRICRRLTPRLVVIINTFL
jgi:hypothetical protein